MGHPSYVTLQSGLKIALHSVIPDVGAFPEMTKAPVARRAKCDQLTPDLEEVGRKPHALSIAIGVLLR